jgi:hypothetical protein
MKAKFIMLFLATITIVNGQQKASFSVPKVIFANEKTTQTLEKILKNAAIEVVEVQDTFLEVNLGDNPKIKTFIDVDGDRQFLIFNGSNALQEGTTATQAKDLVSDMNSQTNLIKATYDEEKNKIDFSYFFWIKDGFTEKSFVSALEMYRLTYMYTFSVDKNNLLK